MPTPIESALIILVPTLNVLPTELIDLCSSLLAQSRAKATNLKPEEEIGRVFCCAHLGVVRLQKHLEIEEIKVSPPVPPRVYRKLYGYLDSALKQTSTPRTPRHRDALKAGSAQNTPSSIRTRNAGSGGVTTRSGGAGGIGAVSGGRRSTRLPPKTVDATGGIAGSASKLNLKSPRNGTPRAAAKPAVANTVEQQHSTSLSNLPAGAEDMITAICTAFNLSFAETYIHAGCEAILATRGYDSTPSSREESPDDFPLPQLHPVPTDSEERGRKRKRTPDIAATSNQAPTSSRTDGKITSETLAGLVVAVALYTIFTLKGEVVSGQIYEAARDIAVASLARGGGEDEQVKKDVAVFLRAAHAEGWLLMRWAVDVQAEAKALKAAVAIAGGQNVKMGEAPRTVAAEITDAEEQGEDISAPAAPMAGVETQAEEATEPELQPKNPGLRTPRKKKAPAKTPLRRREKHAPRPTDKTAKDIGSDGVGDEAGTAVAGGPGRAGLKSGLGTMFHDGVDWLSEERCSEYERWEEWMREEIARIEALEA